MPALSEKKSSSEAWPGLERLYVHETASEVGAPSPSGRRAATATGAQNPPQLAAAAARSSLRREEYHHDCCWGLDLRIDSRKSIHPRRCSLTRLQGSNDGRLAHPKGDRRLRDRPTPESPPSDAKVTIGHSEAQAWRSGPLGPRGSPSGTKVTTDRSKMEPSGS